MKLLEILREFRTDSLRGTIKRYKNKTQALVRQKKVLSRRLKRVQKENTRIKKDVEDLVYEVCTHCGSEIAIRWDVKIDGYIAHCPVCGERIRICSKCDSGIEACGICGFGYDDEGCFQEVSYDAKL